MMMSAGPVHVAVLEFLCGGLADADHFDLKM